MFPDQSQVVYVQQRHGPFRGPLTFILAIWAIAYPALLLLLTALPLIGIFLGIAAGVVLFLPWVLGLLIIGFLRWFA